MKNLIKTAIEALRYGNNLPFFFAAVNKEFCLFYGWGYYTLMPHLFFLPRVKVLLLSGV